MLNVTAEFAAHLAEGTPAPLQLYADASDSAAAADTAAGAGAARPVRHEHRRGCALLVRGIDPLVLAPLAVQDIDVSTPATRSVLVLGT